MRLRATATLSGVFPIDKDGNMLRFSFAPDTLFGDEAALAERCPKTRFVNEKDLRSESRSVPVHLEAGKTYPDETFQGMPGVVEHLKDRGVLVETAPKPEPVETAPPMGDKQTKVEEGIIDGAGNLQSPSKVPVSDDSSSSEF